MAKIVGFGECVLDFSSQQVEEDGTTTFRACPGGSVANLCVATARLGQESAFVGQVGADPFGHALQKCLRQYGVHTDGMLFSDSYGTLLAFATRQADSDVSYHFGNMPSADKFVRYSDLPLALFQEADLVHVSSCAMAEGETQITEAKLLRTLRQWNKIVSYDVNYRAMQYKSMEEARRVTQIPLGYADIVKATEEELALVTGRRGAAGIEALLLGGASVVLITRGSDGSSWHIPGASGDVPVPPCAGGGSRRCGRLLFGSVSLKGGGYRGHSHDLRGSGALRRGVCQPGSGHLRHPPGCNGRNANAAGSGERLPLKNSKLRARRFRVARQYNWRMCK